MFSCQCQIIQTLKPTISLLSNFFKSRLYSCKMSEWSSKKFKILTLPLDEKRKLYKCGQKYVTLEHIPTWKQLAKTISLPDKIALSPDVSINNSLNSSLCNKVSVFHGDITTLEIDAIVNAANTSLRGGGGVDGAIHRAAGPLLVQECATFGGCATGDARITGGYNLPAKYVVHTPGPQGELPDLLQSCYKNSLGFLVSQKLESIAFPCISTGIYGYRNEPAAYVAVSEVRKFLEKHGDEVERVIFCLFLDIDKKIYNGILQSYFPVE